VRARGNPRLFLLLLERLVALVGDHVVAAELLKVSVVVPKLPVGLSLISGNFVENGKVGRAVFHAEQLRDLLQKLELVFG